MGGWGALCTPKVYGVTVNQRISLGASPPSPVFSKKEGGDAVNFFFCKNSISGVPIPIKSKTNKNHCDFIFFSNKIVRGDHYDF